MAKVRGVEVGGNGAGESVVDGCWVWTSTIMSIDSSGSEGERMSKRFP